MTEADANQYRAELLQLVESYEYENCEECHGDVHEHIFAPDVIGKPHAYCMRAGILIAWPAEAEA